MSELRRILAESVPLLERALHDEEASKYPTDLQLRGPVCGLATGALQLYFQEHYGVTLDRRVATPPKAPRGLNARRLQHVGLFDGKAMIDPSFSQFYTYVGLNPDSARRQPALAKLYPADKVAVISARSSQEFADEMAAHMHSIESEVLHTREAKHPSYPPENSLVGATLAKKQDVLRNIWDFGGYESFPIEDQSSSFQRRALRLAMRMHELERPKR